ncbi:hypothetical protein D3C85_1120960 [compost metagenome]
MPFHQLAAEARGAEAVEQESAVVGADLLQLRNGEVEDEGVFEAAGQHHHSDAVVPLGGLEHLVQLSADIGRQEVGRRVDQLDPQGAVELGGLEMVQLHDGSTLVEYGSDNARTAVHGR